MIETGSVETMTHIVQKYQNDLLFFFVALRRFEPQNKLKWLKAVEIKKIRLVLIFLSIKEISIET